MRIVVSDKVDESMEELIGGGLNGFNDETVGYGDRKPLAVLVVDPQSGRTLGGALGRTSLGMLFLELFYLPPDLRGAGMGTRVLQAFEEEGRRRGCVSAVLYTISFQAPKFYERNGWKVFGEVPCLPQGQSRVFLSKTLRASDG
ncbi:MAG TPA: GNAT family N-acetyltransferase [Burkholderiaceae bacterium]